MYSQPVNVVSMHHERHRRQHNKQIKHVMLTRMINALNSLHDPYNTGHNLYPLHTYNDTLYNRLYNNNKLIDLINTNFTIYYSTPTVRQQRITDQLQMYAHSYSLTCQQPALVGQRDGVGDIIGSKYQLIHNMSYMHHTPA